MISGPAEASVCKGSPGGFLVKRILFTRFHANRETGPSVAKRDSYSAYSRRNVAFFIPAQLLGLQLEFHSAQTAMYSILLKHKSLTLPFREKWFLALNHIL